MASVKSALVMVALLALSVELSRAGCSRGLDDCFSTYSGIASRSSGLSCGPYLTLKICVSDLTRAGTCSQLDVDNHSHTQAAYRDNMSCGGSLPKASLIGIVIAAVVGLLFRA